MFDETKYQEILSFFLNHDHKIHQVLLKQGYLPPKPKRNIYALLIGSIIGQRIRFSKARDLRGKLYTKLETDDFLPYDIINLGFDGLTSLGIGEIPSNTIINVTLHIMEQELELSLTPNKIRELKKIKGIGPWTINCTNLMYSLNSDDEDFDDVLLIEDLIIRRGISSLYGIPYSRSISADYKEKVKVISDEWKPHRGLVTWYLWKEFS